MRRSARDCGRLLAACLLIAVVLAAPAALARPSGAGSGRSLSALELSFVRQINDLRAQHGLAPLAVSSALFRSASAHCADMVAGGYFGHGSATGAPIAARMAAFYPKGRHDLYDVGENLLWEHGRMPVSAMLTAWMESPEHRHNILNPAWHQIGLAALTVPSAPGVFGGFGVTVVTADFGVRQ